MKYIKVFIRIEILAAILWMSASPCMAQQNLRSKRAVSKSTVLPSIVRLSDRLSIIEDVKTRFAKWCQKGEFEKLATVDGRLRTQSKEVFDRICQDAISRQIGKHGQFSMGSNRSISTYDSEEETFRVHFTVNGKMVSGEIHVPIDIAKVLRKIFLPCVLPMVKNGSLSATAYIRSPCLLKIVLLRFPVICLWPILDLLI